MGHYAFLDDNNNVIDVITGKDEGEDGIDWEDFYCKTAQEMERTDVKCVKRTSYNTKGGIHYDVNTGLPSSDQSKALRKNYAGIGYTYDPNRDAFIPPKAYDSWTLNEQTCLWEPPVPYPDDGEYYDWDEDTLSWK
jgi:hypothetical protein